MLKLGLAIGAAFIATQAVASDARFEKSLMRLAPSERLEQLCAYAAMVQIRKDARQFRPDRAVANAGAQARVRDNTIKTTGGAFRSKGKWYSLAYTCAATPDHMKVVSFEYKIGAEIPETKWASYGLWD
jgi:hypothetical protein